MTPEISLNWDCQAGGGDFVASRLSRCWKLYLPGCDEELHPHVASQCWTQIPRAGTLTTAAPAHPLSEENEIPKCLL